MEKLLEYQKLDNELYKLIKEVNKSDAKQEVQDLVTYIKEAQSHIIYLDKQSKLVCEDLEKLEQAQKKGTSVVEKYANTNIESLTEAELKELSEKVNQIENQLAQLEGRLINDDKKTKSILQDFDGTKKKMNIAKTRHQEGKAKYDEFYNAKQPEIDEVKKKMVKLESQMDSSVVNRYKALKQDGIRPVVVPLKNNRCSGCQMELPYGSLEKIKNSGKLECPSCRRWIYIEK